MRESLHLAFSQAKVQSHDHESYFTGKPKYHQMSLTTAIANLLFFTSDVPLPLPPSFSRMSAKCHALWVDDRRCCSPPCTDRRTTDGMNGLSAIQSFHPTLLAFESARMARHSRFRRTDGRRKCERLFTNDVRAKRKWPRMMMGLYSISHGQEMRLWGEDLLCS